MSAGAHYEENLTLPRAIRFPIELWPPHGFDPERLETWPQVSGRLEYVEGRLLYMPPCSDVQQYTVTDVVITLGIWVRAHHDFVMGTNEAGMILAGSTRAADAAIWRRSDVGPVKGGLQRHPPVLAVEVAGIDEREADLRAKAKWYLDVGVHVVWLVLPDSREVIVLTSTSETRHAEGATLPASQHLPDLAPRVADLFLQLAGG